ncbi:MAG TPA: hypothetical protein VF043_15010 [Ktedonobacteraceae bacterium]
MEQWEERAGNRAFLKFFCKTMLPGRAFLSHKRKEECVFCSFLRVLKTHGLQNHASYSLQDHGNNDNSVFLPMVLQVLQDCASFSSLQNYASQCLSEKVYL